MLFKERVQFGKRDFQIFRLVVYIHVRSSGYDKQFFRFGGFRVCVLRKIFRYCIFSHDEKHRTWRYSLDLRKGEEVHHRCEARVGVIARRVGMLTALWIVVIIEEVDGKLRCVLTTFSGRARISLRTAPPYSAVRWRPISSRIAIRCS